MRRPSTVTFHSAWGDPVNHPWTTGAPSPTYGTEAILRLLRDARAGREPRLPRRAGALAIADQLDGGLNRTNYQLAARSVDMTPPMLLPGIRLHLNGLKDAYIVESGLFQRWDAAKQTYVRQGDIIDLDGRAKNCARDPAASVCR